MQRHGKRMNFALRIDNGTRLGAVVTPVQVGKEGIRPCLLPAHAHSQLARCPGRDQLFRVQEDLETKAAANIARSHTDSTVLHAKCLCKLSGNADRPLRATPHIQAVTLIARLNNNGAGFHRIDDHPVVDYINVENLISIRFCALQRLVGGLMLTGMPVKSDIVRIFGVKLRGTIGHGGIYIRDGWHAVIAHIDLFKGILSSCGIVSNHHGNNITSCTVDIAHHGRVRYHRHLGAVIIDQAMLAMNVSYTIGIKIRLRCNKPDTSHCRSGRCIN